MNSCDSDRLIFRSHCHADGGDDDKDHYDDNGGLYIINLGLKFPDHSVQWGLN